MQKGCKRENSTHQLKRFGEMMAFKMVGNVMVMAGTRTYDLLESKAPDAQKKAKRLMEFCRKAEACYYANPEYSKLRQQFKDVL